MGILCTSTEYVGWLSQLPLLILGLLIAKSLKATPGLSLHAYCTRFII